jgi:MFS family permease
VVTVIGYVINMLAVPALALAGNWPMAAALIIAERTGRAIRRPAVETMISYTSRHMGSGWAFGLNEALDQGGATVGPLVVALVLYLKGGYRTGFAVLLLPALLCLGTLLVARLLYPCPQALETKAAAPLQTHGFPKKYWWYVGAGALIAAGFADFSLIAFHFQQAAIVPSDVIPIFYAVAMTVGALTALLFGRLFDRVGFSMVLLAFCLAAFFTPLVFFGTFWLALLGMVLWGLGMGAQDSLLTGVVAADKRSTAFGVFDTGFGWPGFWAVRPWGSCISSPSLH